VFIVYFTLHELILKIRSEIGIGNVFQWYKKRKYITGLHIKNKEQREDFWRFYRGATLALLQCYVCSSRFYTKVMTWESKNGVHRGSTWTSKKPCKAA